MRSLSTILLKSIAKPKCKMMATVRFSRLSTVIILALLVSYISPSQGQIVFQKTYGDTGSQCGTSVQQTFDGGYIITGNSTRPDLDHQYVLLIKTNSLGDTVWTRTYGGEGVSGGYVS